MVGKGVLVCCMTSIRKLSIQWKPFWLAIQLYPQNDEDGWQNGVNSFFYHSAILWNSLPFEIQEIQNNQHFKSAVENHWAPFKFITTDDIPSLTTS